MPPWPHGCTTASRCRSQHTKHCASADEYEDDDEDGVSGVGDKGVNGSSSSLLLASSPAFVVAFTVDSDSKSVPSTEIMVAGVDLLSALRAAAAAPSASSTSLLLLLL